MLCRMTLLSNVLIFASSTVQQIRGAKFAIDCSTYDRPEALRNPATRGVQCWDHRDAGPLVTTLLGLALSNCGGQSHGLLLCAS